METVSGNGSDVERRLRDLLQRRAAEVGEWRGGAAEILLDLLRDGNIYLYDIAHDIALAPGLPLFLAVRAVDPAASFDPSASPSYRRWQESPSPDTLVAALRYALDPPPIEEVPASGLRDGDLVVLGRLPQRYRMRVRDHHTEGDATVYTVLPLEHPFQEAEMRVAGDTPVRREVRHVEP